MSITQRSLSIAFLTIYSVVFVTACAYHDRPDMMPDMIPVRPRVKAHDGVWVWPPSCPSLLMSEDGKALVSSGLQSSGWWQSGFRFETRIWDTVSEKATNIIDYGSFPCLAILAESTLLAISGPNEIKIFNLMQNIEVRIIKTPSHSQPISMSFDSKDGDLVVILLKGCKLELVSWDLKSGEMNWSRKLGHMRGTCPFFQGPGPAIISPVLSRAGDLVAWVQNPRMQDRQIEIWEIEGWRQKATFKAPLGEPYLWFSNDGSLLAIATNADAEQWPHPPYISIFIVDVENKVILSRYNSAIHDRPLLSNALAFSRDGHFLATGTDRNGVQLWNVQTLNRLAYIRSLEDDAMQDTVGIEFSPDGRTLYVLNHDGDIRIWDLSGITDSGS